MNESTDITKLLKPREAAAMLPTPQLLTAREAAAALAIGQRTVERLAARGQLRCVRIGRLIRFSPADLADFVSSHRQLAA